MKIHIFELRKKLKRVAKRKPENCLSCVYNCDDQSFIHPYCYYCSSFTVTCIIIIIIIIETRNMSDKNRRFGASCAIIKVHN